MSWLLPSITTLPTGRTRSVGEADKTQLAMARDAKWRRSAKGREYAKQRLRDPSYRAKQRERHKRWAESPKGKAWAEANRERRNYYFRMRYHANPDRRAYLNQKQREYRAARKAA